MIKSPLSRWRIFIHRLQHALRVRLWFPHVPLALLVAVGGILLLQSGFGKSLPLYAEQFVRGSFKLAPSLLPSLLIGGGMLAMALGLLLRSRVAWTVALLLVVTGSVATLFGGHDGEHWLVAYLLLLVVALVTSWRHFDRSSIAASTLFAFTSVAMLLMYATFGVYYMGADYRPPITDLVSALYYAMVTMSTVGYGDITPQTSNAKLLTVSIIVLGISVFATSLTAIIAPLVSRSLQRIVNRKGIRMKRENHFVVIGNTPLAVNTWRELTRRGRPVTRVLRETLAASELADADVVVGDPSATETLRQAGAQNAVAVLAMLADDSENAFVVLATKELGGKARTVAAVNDAHHLSRVKLVQPDLVIAPQVLGGELLAMLLSGEQVTSEFVMQRVFQQESPAARSAAKGKAGD